MCFFFLHLRRPCYHWFTTTGMMIAGQEKRIDVKRCARVNNTILTAVYIALQVYPRNDLFITSSVKRKERGKILAVSMSFVRVSAAE